MVNAFRDDDGLTYDQWRERKAAEADARKAQAGIEQRFAVLERRINTQLGEILRFLGQRFGEERNKLAEDIDAERSHLRNELARFKRATLEAVNDEKGDLRGGVAGIKNRVAELEAEVKQLRQEKGSAT